MTQLCLANLWICLPLGLVPTLMPASYVARIVSGAIF